MWRRKKVDRPERKANRCSFCNKLQDDVPKLIAGPEVFICDECVEVCNDIIADDDRWLATQAGKQVSPRSDDGAAPWPNTILCALCRERISVHEGVVLGGNRGILCGAGVDAVRDASANGQ